MPQQADQSILSEVIAVTGSPSSGKSTFCSFLKECGAFVISADELARRITQKGQQGLKLIVEHFGEQLLLGDGTLNRSALGELVFQDARKRKKLESLLHPLINRIACLEFSAAYRRGLRLLVYDCPLLFETKLRSLNFKAKVLVATSTEHCLERMCKRDSRSAVSAQKRLQAQLPLEEKRKYATHVYDNNGDLEALRQQAKEFLHQIAQTTE